LGERAVAKGPLGTGAETGTSSGGLVQGGGVFGRRARDRKAFGPEGSWSRGVSASLVQEGEAFGWTFHGQGVFGRPGRGTEAFGQLDPRLDGPRIGQPGRNAFGRDGMNQNTCG